MNSWYSLLNDVCLRLKSSRTATLPISWYRVWHGLFYSALAISTEMKHSFDYSTWHWGEQRSAVTRRQLLFTVWLVVNGDGNMFFAKLWLVPRISKPPIIEGTSFFSGSYFSGIATWRLVIYTGNDLTEIQYGWETWVTSIGLVPVHCKFGWSWSVI
jgi:hypothetical protein